VGSAICGARTSCITRRVLAERRTPMRTSLRRGRLVFTHIDVVLPETHSFLANGLLSHNTTVALHAGRERPEGRRHRRVHRRRARAPIPITPRSWASTPISCSSPSPDTGEQALEIMDMLILVRRDRHRRGPTRSRRSCQRAEIEARWATATSACRPVSMSQASVRSPVR